MLGKKPDNQRKIANTKIEAKIRDIHQASKGTYGSPRITMELRNRGICCSRKRVIRLMKKAGIAAKNKT